jgi:hypothetical protein
VTPTGDDAATRVATGPANPDPLLGGRTYAIPFETVWQAALTLADGRIAGWHVVRADDVPGVIQAEVVPRLLGWTGDVLVNVGLDDEAQTRVDLVCSSRGAARDLGTSRRRVIRFFRELDRTLASAGLPVQPPSDHRTVAP